MEPVDKHGKVIYEPAYRRMIELREVLISRGFHESSKTSNIFLFSNQDYLVKINMRDPYYYEISNKPNIFIIIEYNKRTKCWKRLKYQYDIEEILKQLEIKYIISTKYGNIVKNPYNIFLEEERNIFQDDWFEEFYNYYGHKYPNGYCKTCKKQIDIDSYHCSKDCRIDDFKKILAIKINSSEEICPLCKRKVVKVKSDDLKIINENLPFILVEHHSSYFPEKTISICQKCHLEIHKTYKYPELKPIEGDSIRFYSNKGKNKLIECGMGCGKRTRVPVEVTKGFCPKCKKKWPILENQY